MKTKLTTIFKKSANTPPMWVCLLFALVISTNCWADPIAIGTGTVTLNYDNASYPTPITNTFTMSGLDNEVCIAFGNYDSETLLFSGSLYYNSGIEWEVTIVPGVYEIEVTYGTGAWNTKPFFDLLEGNTPVATIFHAPSALNSEGNPKQASTSSTFLLDLSSGLTANKTYTLKVTDGFAGAYGTCIGHISFTPSTSHFATWGYKTGGYAFDDGQFPSNGSDTENGVTIESNISYGEVSQGTYAYKFGSESYVEIYVGAGRVITDIATSVLCDNNLGGEELQISFSSSTPFNQADASKPVTFASNSWDDYCCTSNPSLISLSASIPEGTKSAKITKSASASHDNYLYRLKVVSEDVSGGGGDEHTVYFESSNNNYGTVDVASISSVPDASTVSINNNVLTLNGTDVTATPVSATAEYTYAFSNWSVSNGDEITENQTITATFTRTANSYTLTWDLNGGTVTTAGTGAAVNATGTPNSSVAYGTAITAPVVSKAGVEFIGWSTTPASTMPAANTTYTAQWRSIPAVTNLNAAVDDDDVTISWTNYNKLDLTSDNAKEEGWNDHGTINSRSVANGVLTVSYTTDAEWAWKSIEIPLSREMNHVTSIDMQYTYNNAQAKDGNNEGGIAPYMMYNEDGGWTCFWKRSDPTSLGFWASNVTEYTNYNLTPDQILGSTGSGSYDNQRLIHKVGLLIDPAVASSGTFTVKDICINTTDNQTTLDEIKIIRKKGSAPSSISDGTQVYSGVLNTFTDNNLENGTYYYAVYARKGSNYSEAVTTDPVQIGPETYGLSLHEPGKYEADAPDGYDRDLKEYSNRSYEVYMFNSVSNVGNLYAGSTSSVTDGYALTKTGSSEDVYDGWVAVKPYGYRNGSNTYDVHSEFIGTDSYARISSTHYIRLYVQGYDQFAFAARDKDATDNYLVVKIDGATQIYTPNSGDHISERYTLTTNEPHLIEITASTTNNENRILGFSLRLPVDDTPRSVTYAKGDEEVTGDLPTNTSYAPLAEFTLPNKGNLAWAGHAFIGWSDGSNRYAAGETYTMPAHDVTLTAQWAEIHQPGKYETATASGGYGRTLQTYNNREYEVYEVAVAESKGALYAGPSTEVTNGYQIFTNATNATEIIGDNWVYVKARDYNAATRDFGNEFGQLNSEGTLSPQSARLDNASYVRLYVQGYDQFTFIGIDSYESTPNNYFVIKIDGVTQSYTPDADHYNYTRYDLDESIAHVIEVTANSSDYHNRFFGFSLRLPADDTQRSVTYAKGDEAVTGDLPASGSYVWGETFDLPAQGTLSWAEHYFIGWNDGTATYAPGYTYTMPREAVTFTAQWLAPEYIPTTTSLNSTNVYVSPGKVQFNVDGEGDDEECINIAGKQTAEWKVYFTRGIYKLNMLYGTTSGGVNVTFKIFDGDTELTAYTRNDNHNDGSGVHLYNTRWDLDLRTIDENKLYTVKVIDTWGDTSSKPRVGSLNFSIVSPIVLSDTPVQLTHENVTFSPGTYEMNVDGIDGDETCVDIRDQQKADWLVQITPGYYQISMLYGTPGGIVKVQVMIIDAETGEPVEGKVTTEDIHYSGSSFLAKWGMDLRTGIDEDKTYFVRVKDVFGGDGSKPEVAYINMVSADPITVSSSVKTKLDHNNVTTPYTIEPFDIEDNGSNETCLFIGGNNKADWLAKIAPITYNIRVRYGRTTGTRLTLYIIDGSNHVVWNSETRPTPSGRYEVWEINGIDLSNKVNATDEYIIRIKDDYDGTGSYPYIEYIEFIPKVTYTRTGLTVGNYGTICLPYAVAAEDIHGADIFDMQGWPAGSVAVVLNEVNNMEAGRPYVIQAKATTATWSYYPEGDPTDAGTRNGLIGSYTKEVITPNANNYIVYDNKLYFVDVLAYVGANKAYINRTLAEAAAEPVAPAPGKRQIRLFLNGEQVITDIDQINDQMTNTKYMENGILYILREGKVYNAQGQLVK